MYKYLYLLAASTSLTGVNVPRVNANAMTLAGVLTWIYMIMGVLAVVFVIIGGLRYILSNGDSSKLAQAKNTIMYAIIGLVLVILAYAVTQFVVQVVDGSSWTGFRDSVINTLLFVVGVAAMVMGIVSGVRFTTSAGDPAKAKSAREGLLYSIVGLVIAITAYAIVNFVIGNL